MILKKTNAVLGLMIIAAVICHAGTMTFSLITFWYDFAICKFFAHAAVTFMILHALMSICLFFFQHDGSDMRYSRQNMRTLLQRITAVVMIVLIHFHTSAYAHMATGETFHRDSRFPLYYGVHLHTFGVPAYSNVLQQSPCHPGMDQLHADGRPDRPVCLHRLRPCSHLLPLRGHSFFSVNRSLV